MRDLPSGAVTFLFTDIEGSTQLVQRLRDGYPRALAEHQRLLREAFARHRGHEVDTQGDAFFYAFASAHEAVLAAVEGQRALDGYPWPEATPVRVRMGIHTGRAAPVDGRYTGMAVHRAARICAAAHGGQVVVSQATQSLLEDEEEDLAVRLEDLGQQRLKDIERPVHLYQVAAAGLPTDFPPLRGDEAAVAVPLYRRRSVALAAALVLAVLAAVAALLLTRDADAVLSEVGPTHVGIVDPQTNDIVGEIDLGGTPGAIAAGDDILWVLDPSRTTLARIDRAERQLTDTGGIGGSPGNLAAAGTGAWVSDGCGQAAAEALIRYDTRQTGAGAAWEDIPLDELDLPPSAGGTPTSYGCGLAASAGSIWVALNNPAGAVRVDVDPATDEMEIGTTVALPNGPSAIAVGAGAVWAADRPGDVVRRLHPATGRTLGEVPVGRGPVALAVGGGHVWVANEGDNSVTRLDPLNDVTKSIPVGDGPIAVAFGEGAVWTANSVDGTVSRIDPATERVTATVRVGHSPQGIVVAHGMVWVTVRP
jgi:YVTN family beta-propeller protein